jgi:hypothetical protein
MRPMSWWRVLAVVAWISAAACATPPRVALARAASRGNAGDWQTARAAYDRIAARKDASPTERALALTGAALACDRLDDPAGARARLEYAVAPEIAGVTEPALYYLAEHVRANDRARALNLYYRAAAGAEKQGGSFPYRAAMDRILQMSMTE